MVHQRSVTKRKKFFTFMIVPHNSANRIWRLQLPEWLANIFFGFLITVAILIVLSLLYSSRLTAKLIHYYGLLAENHRQAGQIEYFLKETDRLKQDIDQLEERDQQLREMLGLPRRVLPTKGFPAPNDTRSEVIIQNRYTMLQNRTRIMSEKQYEVQFAAKKTSLRYAYLPSLWPIQGAIRSGYGWRIHPFLLRAEIHRGVDIPTWYGAPIHAVANGKVSYSAFAKGYGYTVMIDHGNGYQSIYGHNSQLLVQEGDIVTKGQLIARAGNSGLATGVHCHYEIRKNGVAINPTGYLNLDIRSASYL